MRVDPYESLAELELTVESASWKAHELATTSGFTRHSTVVELEGGGELGRGEDVTYESDDQFALRDYLPELSLGFRGTLGGFSSLLDELELFDRTPHQRASRDYRRWAFESAAADLALRQGRRSLADVFDRRVEPVRFVASFGLGSPPSLEPLRQRRAALPNLRFKLDAASSWSDELVDGLRELGGVDVVDLKAYYSGTPVDQEVDPELYRRVAEGLPDALLEDVAWEERTRSILDGHRDRIAWDAPIHSVADVDALPFAPAVLNSKPSRFGTWKRLLEFYDAARERGIRLYGGGQFELDVGRRQAQLLAALFHADAPNDLAPSNYNSTAQIDAWRPSPIALAGAPHVGFSP